jgi:putative flavoprotein involved in K+ transport
VHSSQYKGGKQYLSSKIRHVVVIGSNNSAFDICQDVWEQLSVQNGGSVETITMIQRTPSMVVSKESVLQHGLGPLYSEHAALHHEEADLVATTVPYKLAMEKWQRVTRLMQETDANMLDDLTKAGYRLDTGPNGTGIFAKSATEGGGFYIDHGCAELVSRGDVSVCFATVDVLEDFSVLVTHLEDGRQERLPCDMIVYATGFGTMDQWVAKICGPAVANAVGRTWGLGLGHKAKDPGPWEGELRNMWKPVPVDGLWFQGGNLAQSRHYSKYLALQLAARYSGIETTVYGIPQPTPPSL